MKITHRQLRQIIREVIYHDTVSGPAISIIPSGASNFVIAYDSSMLVSEIDRLNSLGVTSPNEYQIYSYSPERYYPLDMIYSGVVVEEDDSRGPCNGAKHVSAAASRIAKQGWGTVVYLAALDELGPIGPDRGSIKPGAEALWRSFERRNDIIRTPYDDISNPKTPDPRDDCKVLYMKDVYVNSSYQPIDEIDAPGVKDMRAMGIQVEVQLSDRWPLASRVLMKVFNEVFQSVYR